MLAQNVERRIREEMVDVGDTAVQRILDGDEAKVDRAFADRGKSILEGGGGDRFAMGKRLAGGEVGIGPGLALKDDAARFVDG